MEKIEYQSFFSKVLPMYNKCNVSFYYVSEQQVIVIMLNLSTGRRNKLHNDNNDESWDIIFAQLQLLKENEKREMWNIIHNELVIVCIIYETAYGYTT